MTKICTLDLGTTYFKAALFDDAGNMLCGAHEPLSIEHPQPGWWELPGDSFERHVIAVLGKLRAASDDGFDAVGAITFATQANSARYYDKAGNIASPMVLWLDERAASYGNQLRTLAGPDHPARTGIPKLTGGFLAARLLRWANENDDWHNVSRVSVISDVLTSWFTGQHVTEAGASGLTALVDIHNLTWIDELIDATKLDRSCFATIARAGTDLGAICKEAAEQFGFPRDCRFVVGCLDQYAGAIGAGNVFPGVGAGIVSETTGTVLATVRCADRFMQNAGEGVYQGPGFAPGVYFSMAFGSISANLLEAYRNSLEDKPSFDELNVLAAAVAPGADGLRVSDDAKPTDIGSLFVNLNDAHTRGHCVRAILEGVAWKLSEQVATLCDGRLPEVVRAVGGAARSDLWRQIKADILNVPIVATTCEEPTSLGAAMLAGSALFDTDLRTLAKQWIKTREPNEPNAQMHARYAATKNP